MLRRVLNMARQAVSGGVIVTEKLIAPVLGGDVVLATYLVSQHLALSVQ